MLLRPQPCRETLRRASGPYAPATGVQVVRKKLTTLWLWQVSRRLCRYVAILGCTLPSVPKPKNALQCFPSNLCRSEPRRRPNRSSGQVVLLLVATVGGVPRADCQSRARVDASALSLLEKLLNQVDVGHDHAATAVSLETELVHSVSVCVLVERFLSTSSAY